MKRLIKIGLVLVALVVIGGLVLVFSLDRLAAEAVRRGGTYALGVETTVEAVEISLGSEVDASLTGLSIANPEGFDGARFAGLGSGSLAFPVKGVFADVVSVPELALGGIEINLERRNGKTNYDAILANLEKLGDGDAGSKPGGQGREKEQPKEKAPGGKRYAIERIVLTDIDATIDLLPMAGDATRVSIHLPEVVIENLSDDMSTAEIFGVVIRALLTAVLQNAGDLLPADMLKDLGGKLGGLGDLALDLSGGAVESSKAVLAKGEELLKGGAEKLGEEAGEALKKGLGGLLKKDK